jgi:glycosyltransferase involved in cell wall biosynthesis
MESPLVSVLMCFYNEKEDFLRKSIESILNQSYKKIEFIIIGDCPPNNLPEVVKAYQLNDSRIVFYENPQNLGLTKSLNIGLSKCKGKYIVRMDADDISLPDRIEKQVRFMEKHPDLIASGGCAYAIDEEDHITHRISVSTRFHRILKTTVTASPILHPSAIIRRNSDFHIEYDESFKYAQDYALWVAILEKYLRGISNINSPVIKYRYSSGQIFKKHKDEQKDCADRLLKRIEKLYDITIRSEYNDVWETLLRNRDLQESQLNIYEEFIRVFRRDNTRVKAFIIKHISNILIINYLSIKKRGHVKSLASVNYILTSLEESCFDIKFLLASMRLDTAKLFS